VADVEGTEEAESISGGTGSRKKEHMRDPEGRNYYVTAKIGEKEMIAFLFAHNYRQPIMIIAMIVAIIWPIMTIVRQDGSLWYAIAVVVIVFFALPYSTWSRGRKTIRDNEAYANTFYYMFDEWGLHLELGDSAVDQEWSKINKCMFLKSVTVLYTGRNNAFLIPTEAMGSRAEEINAFIKENRSKK
ncbi:MAG: hypothetical protein LUF92_04530, partial [Clostridiales bacterium]|nr:hypothetical protein [Clostridiales bacterium]